MSGESCSLRPVGVVRSQVKEPADAPRQGRDAGLVVRVEIFPEFLPALEGLVPGQRVVMVCWFHRADREALRVRPRGDLSLPVTGVFNTRSPNRPNPLALHTAEILAIDGGTLTLKGVDAVDGTPVLDIRPHVPRLDG